ncbi:hypothetical protein [uncultured Brachyspira sp.]|uniref:hypothetical protein n=1 Tax=uncultured Brachyspira sp. TaxID=221953 RepID=UPI0025D2A5F0|nr:hypothetical protein [uncultured Brachyspira sp.]
MIIGSIIKSIKLVNKDEEIEKKEKYIISLFSFLGEYISGIYVNTSIMYIITLIHKEEKCFYIDCINNNYNRVLHSFEL